MSASRSHATTEWNSAFSLPLPTYSFVATENVVTFLPLASTRSSGSRVRRPVSRTLFIGPIPPGRPGLRSGPAFEWRATRRAGRRARMDDRSDPPCRGSWRRSITGRPPGVAQALTFPATPQEVARSARRRDRPLAPPGGGRHGGHDPADEREVRYRSLCRVQVAEDGDQLGIELRPGVALDLADRLGVCHCPLVWAVGGHRVVGVRERHDPSTERDLRPPEAVGIAVPAKSLVMVEDDRDGVTQRRRLLQDHLADPRVLHDRLPFDRRERGGLLEDLLRKGQLADIVEQGGEPQAVDLRVGQGQAAGHAHRKRGDCLLYTSPS